MPEKHLKPLRYASIVFALIVGLIGMITLGLGLTFTTNEVTLSEGFSKGGAVFVILLGLTECGIAGIGITYIHMKHIFRIKIFVFLLIGFVFIKFFAGIFGYFGLVSWNTTMKNDNERSFEQLVDGYYLKPEYKTFLDIVQHEYDCCGSKGPEDYDRLPQSCCPSKDKPCQTGSTYKEGCADRFFTKYKRKLLQQYGIAHSLFCVIEWLAAAVVFTYQWQMRNVERLHVSFRLPESSHDEEDGHTSRRTSGTHFPTLKPKELSDIT